MLTLTSVECDGLGRVLASLVRSCLATNHEDNDVAAEASEVNAMRPDLFLSLSLPEADSLYANKSCEIGAEIQAEERRAGSQSLAGLSHYFKHDA